ncbi:unnamed protein product [Owenia fusiformis]|uniref:Protein kinase domain-containing protein n=1 Tax=Owenia fusiformis TaxID=6347 RepID=A0A8S4P7R5_OWEFU|nr:unnamed protein product [Owenia fusiformis]
MVMLKHGDRVPGRGSMLRVGTLVGQGRCCEVYRVKQDDVKEEFALKIYKKESNYAAACRRETSLLEMLKARGNIGGHLVETLDQFQYKGHEMILQELLDCTLRELMLKVQALDSTFSFFLLQKFTQDILVSLSGLHLDGFIHADLKPANIQWSPKDSCLKLIDFGLSFHKADQNIGTVQSPAYQSPESKFWNEVHPETTNCNTAIDMWGMGCVMAEMYSSEKLFPHSAAISSNKCDACQAGGSQALCMYSKKVQEDLLPRATFDNTTRSHFLQYKDLLLKFIHCDAEKRTEAHSALNHPFFSLKLEPSFHDLILLPTCILRLLNAVDEKDVQLADEFLDLSADIRQECSRFGPIHQFIIPDRHPGLGKVYIHYKLAKQCAQAFQSLNGRTFNGHTIITTYYPHHLMEMGQFY